MLLITTQEGATAWMDGGFTEPATIVALDLAPLDARFRGANLAESAFLGCAVGPTLLSEVHRQGAGFATHMPGFPALLRAFGTSAYTVDQLYSGIKENGEGWEDTPDYAGFKFFMDIAKKVPRALSLVESAAARLHDTSQELALASLLREKDVVAIMGGHDFRRELSPEDIAAKKPDVYWECVAIAKGLTEAGFVVVTGGGPGLMEAGNLGALLATSPPDLVARVKKILVHRDFASKEWRSSAMAARREILGASGEPGEHQFSVGVPTWLYGHEPPNFFASYHSKMFYNSLREDGLVTIANKGIIFFEGNAGTVQEVFQDVTQNYYRPALESATPLVFYNTNDYWDRPCDDLTPPTTVSRDKRKPLLPLVKQLAAEKRFTDAVLVTTSVTETIDFIKRLKSDKKARKADERLANSVWKAL